MIGPRQSPSPLSGGRAGEGGLSAPTSVRRRARRGPPPCPPPSRGGGGFLAITVALLFALPARAAEVTLREAPQAAAKVTLGDLFEGAGQAADVFVAPSGPAGSQAVLDAGAVQLAAKRAGLDWANAEGRRRIVIASVAAAPPPSAARAAQSLHAVSAKGDRRSQALAYARNLNAGEVVAASDLVWSAEAVAPGDAPADADLAIGKAARRPLREGAAVALHDLASPRVIHKDEIVDVAFEEAGVTLVLQAKALADAAVGEPVAVQNIVSKKTLAAVAAGPGRALVGPAAEALRASPSYSFASR